MALPRPAESDGIFTAFCLKGVGGVGGSDGRRDQEETIITSDVARPISCMGVVIFSSGTWHS